MVCSEGAPTWMGRLQCALLRTVLQVLLVHTTNLSLSWQDYSHLIKCISQSSVTTHRRHSRSNMGLRSMSADRSKHVLCPSFPQVASLERSIAVAVKVVPTIPALDEDVARLQKVRLVVVLAGPDRLGC